MMYVVTLKKNEEKRIMGGHPWVYANEVSKISGHDEQGSVAKVTAYDGRFIGYGFINHLSKIIVRIISRNEYEVIDEDFFYKRISESNNRRIELGYSNNYRVVFGENDLLPGLICDKYGDYLSVQFLSLGMDIRKELIVNALVKIFNPKGIYERSDVGVRQKEGLKEFKGPIYGDFDSKVEIIENGIKMMVDLENGQKTGYFLDQKENRDNLKYYVKDKVVLDCFSNVGGFALNAAKHHAKKVYALDISQRAVDEINENAKLNGFDNIEARCCDVFLALREYRKNKEKFDVIVLDPPAFTKSFDTVKEGYLGYLDINTIALKLLKKNGILVSCSCSQHMTLNLFLKMISEASERSGLNTQLVELRMQGKDHAALINSDEGLYLKVVVVRLI